MCIYIYILPICCRWPNSIFYLRLVVDMPATYVKNICVYSQVITFANQNRPAHPFHVALRPLHFGTCCKDLVVVPSYPPKFLICRGVGRLKKI